MKRGQQRTDEDKKYFRQLGKQNSQLENLNKSIETVEIAVIGLNDEVEKFKTEGNKKVK